MTTIQNNRHFFCLLCQRGDVTTSYAYYDQPGHASLGRVKSITNDSGSVTYFAYDFQGRQTHTWGDVPQPSKTTYDQYGDRTEFHTYRDDTLNWSSATMIDSWPVDGTASDKTTWVFDAATGLLTSKIYDDLTHVDYDYTMENQLSTRTWARGISTVYSYDPNTDELTSIDYSDTVQNPDITQTYTRIGELDVVTDNRFSPALVHDHGYSDEGETTSETVTGLTASALSLTRGFTATVPQQFASVSVGTSYAANYYYDATTGRMARVTGPGLPTSGNPQDEVGVVYGYVLGTNLVETVDYRGLDQGAVTTRLRSQRSHESESDHLTNVSHTWLPDNPDTLISNYAYVNDPLGRRTRLTTSGTAFTDTTYTNWGYNGRNELTGSNRLICFDAGACPDAGNDVPIEAEQLAYDYDAIGNRESVTVGQATPVTQTYVSNSVNQYGRSVAASSSIDFAYTYDDDGNLTSEVLAGDCNCDGSVGVGDINAYTMALIDPVAYAATYPGCTIVTADINGDGQVTVSDTNLFIALLSMGLSGGRSFTWDHENRLATVEPQVPNVGDVKVTFAYDFRGRRVRKVVYEWDDIAQDWTATPATDIRFVYNGWLLLMEFDALNSDAPLRKYTHGLDLPALNGRINRATAGGINGLLSLEDLDSTTMQTGSFAYTYDANGNIGQVIDVDDGSVAARYEYDPYGQRVNAASAGELNQPFRFSTKYWDDETGLGYWGYRHYSPVLGRWANRDPLGYRGGHNLFSYSGNRPNGSIDFLGLISCQSSQPATQPTSRPVVEDCPTDGKGPRIVACLFACAKGARGAAVCYKPSPNSPSKPCICVCPEVIKSTLGNIPGADRIVKLIAECVRAEEYKHIAEANFKCKKREGVVPGLTELQIDTDPSITQCPADVEALKCAKDILSRCKGDTHCRAAILAYAADQIGQCRGYGPDNESNSPEYKKECSKEEKQRCEDAYAAFQEEFNK